MRKSLPLLLATLLAEGSGCELDIRCGAGTVTVGGRCRAVALDAGDAGRSRNPATAQEAGPPQQAPGDAHASTSPSESELDAGARDASTPADMKGDNGREAGAPADGAGPDSCVATREVCNGEDDDCDGEVDNGVLVAYFVDADGDGFGGGQGIVACKSPSAGYSDRPGDCDDACKTCYPQATETACDNRDNDCDAETDEGLKGTYFRDADRDGFGTSARMVAACAAPEGYVANSGDCDDDCASCNPSKANDISCDGKDDDCSGGVDEDAAFVIYYLDCDRDGYSPSDQGWVRSCAPPAPVAGCAFTTRNPTAPATTDCNDANHAVNPGQTAYQYSKIPGAVANSDYDYNCNAREELEPLLSCTCGGVTNGDCYAYYPTGYPPDPKCGDDYPIARVFTENGKCKSEVSPIFPTYKRGCK